MTPDMLSKLRALGYEVGIASGGVQPEHDAIAKAQELASPARVLTDASQVTAATVADLRAIGKLPTDDREQAELVARISQDALKRVKHARSEAVAFHEKALEIAQGMPTTYVVSGHGISCLYFSLDDKTGEGATENDQAIVASLLDPKAHAERVKQARAAAKPEK